MPENRLQRSQPHLQRGFSVAEILVATAIFALIFVAALMIYDRSNKVFKIGVEAGDLQQNTRIAFDRLVSDIRMAGYDYDRDGVPKFENQAQQPDEQIEYAGDRAITFRANFNFADQSTQGGRVHGVERNPPAPATGDTDSKFPVVTTGNNEIVTFALRSTTGTNPDTITFFADVTDGTIERRQSYPDGEAEDQIDIDDVDLCTSGTCDDPPYDLLRITLSPTGTPVVVPIASNIRTVQFQYFSDTTGQTALVVADPGGGQFDPANAAASTAPRAIRSGIRSVRVNLIGMNEAPDLGYTNPTEPLAGFQNRRTYALSTLLVPRNFGRRGLREQLDKPPGPPQLRSVCFGYCGAVVVKWDAPAFNAAYGEVESYSVLYDTDTTAPPEQLPANEAPARMATEFTLSGLDPATPYRFTVVAINSYGDAPSMQYVVGTPKNATTCDPPTALVATNAPSALPNEIALTWTAPGTNASPYDIITCVAPGGGVTSSSEPPAVEEFKGYEIHRSTDPMFDPVAATQVGLAPGGATTYSDKTAANCIDYYYRLRLAEHCIAVPANQNETGVSPWSLYEPDDVGGTVAGVIGRAESGVAPSAPSSLQVLDASVCASGLCDVVLQWPAVQTDESLAPIAVNSYEIAVTQNGTALTGSPFTTTVSSGEVVLAGGLATWTHEDIPEVDGGGAPYTYEYVVRAAQCGLISTDSPPATFPKCVFSGGAAIINVDSTIGGSGTAGDPWEVIDANSVQIMFDTAVPGMLKEVAANSYFASTNVAAFPLGSTTGPFQLTWPGGDQDEIYRIDYEMTDTSDCKTAGSFYIKSTAITCPFEIPAVITRVDDEQLTFALLNNLDFGIKLSRVQITWNELQTSFKASGGGCPAASSCYSDIDATSGLQVPSGATFVNCSLAPAAALTTSGTFTGTVPATSSALPALDQTGTFLLKVNFVKPGGAGTQLTTDAITGITIFYRVNGIDTILDPERECVVYP